MCEVAQRQTCNAVAPRDKYCIKVVCFEPRDAHTVLQQLHVCLCMHTMEVHKDVRHMCSRRS